MTTTTETTAAYTITTAEGYTPSPYGVEWDAAQLAPRWYGDDVVSVHLRSYGPHEFGPSGDVTLADGRVKWVCFPGGMRHSDFYRDGR